MHDKLDVNSFVLVKLREQIKKTASIFLVASYTKYRLKARTKRRNSTELTQYRF